MQFNNFEWYCIQQILSCDTAFMTDGVILSVVTRCGKFITISQTSSGGLCIKYLFGVS